MNNNNLIKEVLIPTKISRINLDNNSGVYTADSSIVLNNNNIFNQNNIDVKDNKIPSKLKHFTLPIDQIISGENFSNIISDGERYFYTSEQDLNINYINPDTFISSKIDLSNIQTITSNNEGRIFLSQSNELYYAGNYFDKVISSPTLLPSFNINLTHNTGAFFGDPHIITLTGQRYYFDYLGNFRLFKYQTTNDLIIINGLSQRGTQRWKKKQYIKKLFIKYNNKEILIDLGFRGEKCTVIKNKGFEYEENNLEMHPDHKIHCFNRYCLKEFNNWEEAQKHLKQVRNKHTVKPAVRNEIIIIIPELLRIECSNINSYNFQPCRLIVTSLPKLNKSLATGTIVDPKYSNNPQLEDITDIKDINYNFDFIPKYEIASELIYLEADL